MDLSVQTGKKQNKMRFLITDLGHEDLILGYPWLAIFEPKFGWADGTIDMEHLPVIVKSLNWETRLTKATISQATVEPISIQEKMQIVEELEGVLHYLHETSARSSSIPTRGENSGGVSTTFKGV